MHSLQSITDFIRWGASRFNEAELFFGHGTDNALDEAATLVLHALHLPPDLPGSWFSGRLTSDEREHVISLIQRRIDERIPLPYLLGEAWFAGMRFHVSPDVLIPRSPIAELVENGFEPWVDAGSVERVLDLCCGSGCIGIAAAAYLPQVNVDLVDISEAALRVAKQNIVEHGLEERVRALQSDLFSSLQGERYDVIVSNPPYVGEAELASLPKEYAHEPRLALEAEEEGLALVKRILREASEHLTPQGILVVEVGNSAETLSRRYPEVPFLWVDFTRGGEGVFVFTAAELEAFSGDF
jgi:ribosomal protein L3 glutamine methyltransferase